jgi:hypothetical protein
MERINTTVSYEAYAFGKRPASLNEIANLQDLNDSLDPQSFKSEESSNVPSAELLSAKSSVCRLFEHGEAGIWLLNSLMLEIELKSEQFNAQDAKSLPRSYRR